MLTDIVQTQMEATLFLHTDYTLVSSSGLQLFQGDVHHANVAQVGNQCHAVVGTDGRQLPCLCHLHQHTNAIIGCSTACHRWYGGIQHFTQTT